MLVFVKTIEGVTHSFDVEAFDNMHALKLQIETKTGILTSHQRLIFAGKQLEDNRSFSAYCIQKESTLHLVLRQLGGNEVVSGAIIPHPKRIPLNKDIFTFNQSFLDPKFISLMESIQSSNTNSNSNITKVTEEVFSFPILSKYFCEKLSEEINSFRKEMNDSGVALPVSHFGLQQSIKELVSYISPLMEILYPQFKNIKYDVYPKIMTYEMKNNEDWPAHRDGDLATLNICLSENFKGTDLRLFNDNGNYIDYKHEIGRMVTVLGNNVHSVTPLIQGMRYSLIIKLNQIN